MGTGDRDKGGGRGPGEGTGSGKGITGPGWGDRDREGGTGPRTVMAEVRWGQSRPPGMGRGDRARVVQGPWRGDRAKEPWWL